MFQFDVLTLQQIFQPFEIFHLQIKIDFLRKTKEKYQQMFKSSQINWCSLMGGKLSLNSYIKMFVSIFKKVLPQICHDCPYHGIHSGENISLPWQFVSFHPPGAFRLIVTASDDALAVFRYQLDISLN